MASSARRQPRQKRPRKKQVKKNEKVKWKKPTIGHLNPVRKKKSQNGKTEYVNYEPREDRCKAACTLGKKLKVPVYVFLKESLTRQYGADFYEALCAAAENQKQSRAKTLG